MFGRNIYQLIYLITLLKRGEGLISMDTTKRCREVWAPLQCAYNDTVLCSYEMTNHFIINGEKALSKFQFLLKRLGHAGWLLSFKLLHELTIPIVVSWVQTKILSHTRGRICHILCHGISFINQVQISCTSIHNHESGILINDENPAFNLHILRSTGWNAAYYKLDVRSTRN